MASGKDTQREASNSVISLPLRTLAPIGATVYGLLSAFGLISVEVEGA
jgi:hypothetical protein